MKSKAHLKTHPLHPMLVVFPIAFFTGALVFDLLSFFVERNDFAFVAHCLVIGGIAGGVLAAVPGIIDAIFTVPPGSSAGSRVVKHGLLNSVVLITFITVYIIRDDVSDIVILLMEALAVLIMWISGWLGGTLVHRNHIGVYNRYADSGHWQEQTFSKDVSYPVEVAKAQDLKPDQMKMIRIGNKRIVVARTSQNFVAFEDRCTHKGASLAGGTMICGTVQCPWHGSQFDVSSGEVKAGPAKKGISTYRVTEENGRVLLHR